MGGSVHNKVGCYHNEIFPSVGVGVGVEVGPGLNTVVFRLVAGAIFCTRSHPIHDAAMSQWSPGVRQSSTCTIDCVIH